MKPLSFLVALSVASPLFVAAQDDFLDAFPVEFLAEAPVVEITGSTVDATAQFREPFHAGIAPTHSVWIALTVDAARRVELTGRGEAAAPVPALPNILFSVYTGSALSQLKVVQRYELISSPASSRSRHPGGEPFTRDARVVFDAEPGTTYYIAVDSETGGEGRFVLNLSDSRDNLTPELTLIEPEAEWSYYQAIDTTTVPGTVRAFNPATTDPDFYTTWHTAAAYNGPAFAAPRKGPFGYGTINGEPFRSFNLATPAADQRAAVTYFRTTFVPERGVQELGFEGMFDDGVVIYINGEEATRINMPAFGTVTSTTLANGASFTANGVAISNEDAIQYATAGGLNLPAGEEVEIGVSLHNGSATSSDSSFHMRVYATKADPVPALVTVEPDGFEDFYRLTWPGRVGFSYQVEFSDTGLEDGDWELERQGVTVPREDGTVLRVVRSQTGKSFWRVITTRLEEGE